MMKKDKRIIIVIAIVLAIILIFLVGSLLFNNDDGVKTTVNVVDTIEDYGYTLEDNETTLYNNLFNELKEILKKEENESEYAKVIAKLFVADFYTLENKLTKNDIGGLQFIYSSIKENFALKASDTFYKYLENNLNGKREKKYPIVKEFTDESIKEITYTIDKEEINAYQVDLTWKYDKETDYQNKATIILVKEDKKISIVEIKKEEIDK